LFCYTDSISKIIKFLQNEGVKSEKLKQMVRITPIMSHDDLSVSCHKISIEQLKIRFQTVDSLIQMETLCSMLLGPEGNYGFNFIGRFTKASKENFV
jgi:hypothetical protein